MAVSKSYYLSVGSNLGNKKNNLQHTVDWLHSHGEILAVSSLYQTSPVNMIPDAPPFYNLAALLETPLQPIALLKKLKEYEKIQGRTEDQSQTRPRIIDIDILLADDMILESQHLTIPHPRMTQRAFVLIPLCEIAPDLIHPVLKKTMATLLRNLETGEIIKKIGRIIL